VTALVGRALPLGSTTPRLWTPEDRDLTEPGASFGQYQSAFAKDILRSPFDPWQDWLTLHAGERLEDGRPRFWLIIVLVSRQNGKTFIPVVLSPYWSFLEKVPMILGTSTKLDYAKESWMKAIELIRKVSDRPGKPLWGRVSPDRRKWTRQANGEQEWNIDGSRYKIAPATGEGGRSLTIHRLILDELRQHHDRSAWDAAVPATEAVADAQVWALSNAGDDSSVVLNEERASALETISSGRGDRRVGIFEWSAPDGSDPTDPEALAVSNPQFGHRMDRERMLSRAATAVRIGGQALTGFKTESMCMSERVLDPAVEPSFWARCLDPGSLASLRRRTAVVVDVSKDNTSVVLYAAAVMPDGRTRVDPVRLWTGAGCVDTAEREMGTVLAMVRPAVFGWFPSGPAAAMAAKLRQRKRQRPWLPAGTRVEEVKAEVPAVCMGFQQQVAGLRVAHSGDPLLDAQIGGAGKLWSGKVWVFKPPPGGHVNAVYAAAGAVHLARTLTGSGGGRKVLTVAR
jgi:hypothetical protein